MVKGKRTRSIAEKRKGQRKYHSDAKGGTGVQRTKRAGGGSPTEGLIRTGAKLATAERHIPLSGWVSRDLANQLPPFYPALPRSTHQVSGQKNKLKNASSCAPPMRYCVSYVDRFVWYVLIPQQIAVWQGGVLLIIGW